MLKSDLVTKLTANYYKWGADCDSWNFVDEPGLSVKYERMPPSAKEVVHLHKKAQQFFFILQGTATFYLADETILVGEEEGLLIRPATRHYIANETTDVLAFLVISQPTTNQDRLVI